MVQQVLKINGRNMTIEIPIWKSTELLIIFISFTLSNASSGHVFGIHDAEQILDTGAERFIISTTSNLYERSGIWGKVIAVENKTQKQENGSL